MPPLSLTSRADLLRELKHCQKDSERSLVATILGYEKAVVQKSGPMHRIPAGTDEKLIKRKSTDPKKSEIDSTRSEKIPDEGFIVLRNREAYTSGSKDGVPECLQGVVPLSDDDVKPKNDDIPLSYEPLVQQRRLLPFLRESLVYPLGERLDVASLVKKSARLEVLQRIPRKAHVLPAGRVYVLLDLNKRLLPFWQDAHQLCELLARKLGKNGLDIRVLEEMPGGRYSNWFDEAPVLQEWKALKTPASVLIVSDLGGLASGDAVRYRWRSFVQQLGRKSIRPIVLTPCAQPVCREFRLQVDLVSWGRGSHFKKQTVCRENPDFSVSVRRVLGLLSVAVHVEPILLRAILSCLPVHEADSDVEAAVYFHNDVSWGHSAMAVKAEKRDAYREVFRNEETEVQRQVLLLIRQHHIGQFPFVWASTVLNAQPLVKFPIDELPDADVAWATQLMQRLTRSFAGQVEHQGMRQFAQRELQRLGVDDDGDILQQQSYASFLYGLAHRDSLLIGKEIPAKHDARLVQAALEQAGELVAYQLLQRGESLFFKSVFDNTEGDFPLLFGSQVASFSTRLSFLSYQLDDGLWQTVELNSHQSLCHIPSLKTLQINTGQELLTFDLVTKPSWGQLSRSALGLEASLLFAGETHAFSWGTEQKNGQYMGEWSAKKDGPVNVDEYGLYADLSIQHITQRFRWIEPGTFMMGSPETEAGRDGDEELHQVTLTQGFWLADTTVTQALWEAVMSETPSHFKNNPNNPVENVSWDDCQRFIQALNNQFSDLQAALPTEAQWEYACRAGTDSLFFFGGKDDLNLERVNYSGQWDKYDPNGKTKAVKSHLSNDWGLYEMHGNVWEWCQDVWEESLGKASVIDPVSDQAGVKRVMRGGSWDDGGGFCRSATRYWSVPGDRDDRIGFRLSLGHAELGAGSAVSGANVSQDEAIADSAAAGSTVAEQVPAEAVVAAAAPDKLSLSERLSRATKGVLEIFRGKE